MLTHAVQCIDLIRRELRLAEPFVAHLRLTDLKSRLCSRALSHQHFEELKAFLLQTSARSDLTKFIR